MRILVFGGAGFVGLNIAAALLACGHAVTLFDRAGLPPDARKEFALHGDRLTAIQGDVTDSQAVGKAIATGYDAIILGAAITAGPAREASDPETILRVNLLAQAPILIAAFFGSLAFFGAADVRGDPGRVAAVFCLVAA